MAKENILIVDDDKNILEVLGLRLEAEEYKVAAAAGVEQALIMVKEELFDLALVDLKLSEQENGIDLMEKIHQVAPETPVIILTAYGTIDTAVEAMKRGAYSYVTKPFNRRELLLQIKKGLEKNSLSREVRRLRTLIGERYGFENIIGRSKEMLQVLEQAARAAETDSNVCIFGESGTGKELIAKSLHLLSLRKEKPFVAVNCAAIPEGLHEAELFGYERGAFTGAVRDKKGFFAQAHEGTIFLDEISEMPESLQAKLLRVLQEKQFYPLGREKPTDVNIRIVTATNKNLEDDVKKGKFRQDLFYRIYVIPLYLPPLRERKEDIPLLVDHFLKKYNRKMKKGVKGFSTAAIQKLMSYPWPGNVRELENTIEYAVAMTAQEVVNEDQILQTRNTQEYKPKTLREAKNQFEKEYLSDILSITGGNVSNAARIAGKYRPDLYTLLKKHDLSPSNFKR